MPRATTAGDAGVDECRCGHPAWHCDLGHHHVVPSLATECSARVEAATRPQAVA